MNAYDIGDKVHLTAAFTDAYGVAADPGTVTLRVRPPRGATTSYGVGTGVVKDSTGNYHYDLLVSSAGTWTYRWEGTNGVETAEETQLYVRRSAF